MRVASSFPPLLFSRVGVCATVVPGWSRCSFTPLLLLSVAGSTNRAPLGRGGGREAGRHQRIWEIEKYDFSLPLYPRPFESQNIVCDTSRRGRLGKRERTPQKEEKKDKQSHTKAFLSSLSSLPKRGGEEEEARQAEKSPSPLCSRFFQKPRKTIIIVAVVVVVAAEDSFPSFFFFFFLE